MIAGCARSGPCSMAEPSRGWRIRSKKLSPDIIHINKQNLEDGLDLLLAARRSNLPRVATIHITHGMASLRAIGGRTRFCRPASSANRARDSSPSQNRAAVNYIAS